MSIIEAFIKTISFFDELKDEGIIEDYALIGGLALSAWVRPRTMAEKYFLLPKLESIIQLKKP
ncbi:MAG: hypothetical protein A2077_00755 [Nitrospirae bacterium GWC2_46_6]|nr:MAG: hypothetical protein A2077_00755 [Nitrospirae bacterium GWC2_46_6]OGW21595.1 MAG: hypothetical protein A2Z82_04745 [Nitrospirae bacterium GWA2_46_11]OGW25248.1 MAG: hypothetical protein A2X55_08685 [Nitrospirae bacterium GWB2_47_37]HAK89530.1 hypothetical protein [Nitrospiraceae bacterium]OGW21596.1 MAG: hypothetical protein A2Z82_04750 [Nitrospirae bacterium GWA2_46_11]